MKQSSPASFDRVSSESQLVARLRNPDVASQMKSKFREVGLRSTRTRVALGSILFGKGDRHVSAEMLFEEARIAATSAAMNKPFVAQGRVDV
jgi:hypothetical protein